MVLNVLSIGGSRHIGYYSALRFLEGGSTVTFLLRNPATFDANETIQSYVKSGKARLVKGDALVQEDIKRLWAEASSERPVDLLIFTLGFTGKASFHILKGFQITPPNLVTQALLNVLSQMPQTPPLSKVIVLSTAGVSRSSLARVPFLLKILYGWLIAQPLRDKLGMERVISHCAGWEWNTQVDGEPGEEIMGREWKEIEGLPAPGTLKDAMVLRAAGLTDGECLADKRKEGGKIPYRAGEGHVVGWTVSRKDVAHFIENAVLNHWSEYGNKQIGIAY